MAAFLGYSQSPQTNTSLFCTLCPHSCAPGKYFSVGHPSLNYSRPSTLNFRVLWRWALGKEVATCWYESPINPIKPWVGCYIIHVVWASPNEVCYVEHLAQPPKPKRKRTTSALALEKAPEEPAPSLRTLNEKLEDLSDIIRGMEKSNNLRDKLIKGMNKQLGISFKLIRSLRSDKDKLEAEIAALHKEIQGLNKKGQP